MKRKDERWKKILMVALIVLMLSSGLMIFTPRGSSNIKVKINIYFDPMRTFTDEIYVGNGSTVLNALNLYLNHLLENQFITGKTLSLTSEGKLDCIINYCKTSDKAWNLYLNDNLVDEKLENVFLKEGDYISFKYEFINRSS
ncbi:MAG: hypothetical protein OH319_00795 [Candidatus Parvarchaeota archaeon]|nr:hypothetical protein [Candidatus Jingweiarchaeum tengchongense]MCW1297884.1 hypothetical protein [Candidatus Jingweiarchaeum tengchongense]MCW1299895.1 hypothetical protein [Candidatus Jingweiarchaeum tengchongense]MCW1305101.1 hypothetical protein [Candidatus Jingweiarchaeum tengchongense]MCW1305163.1 hypothetical protein [Candidatus Jingweiarchaeum tengchongense]